MAAHRCSIVYCVPSIERLWVLVVFREGATSHPVQSRWCRRMVRVSFHLSQLCSCIFMCDRAKCFVSFYSFAVQGTPAVRHCSTLLNIAWYYCSIFYDNVRHCLSWYNGQSMVENVVLICACVDMGDLVREHNLDS